MYATNYMYAISILQDHALRTKIGTSMQAIEGCHDGIDSLRDAALVHVYDIRRIVGTT